MLSRCLKIPEVGLDYLKSISSGIYILEMYSEKKFTLNNKIFADTILEEGFYFYVGSAQKNFSGRVIRHFKKSKFIHWHIDYITTNKSVEIISALILPGAEKPVELEIAKDLEDYFNLNIPIMRFGNSDTNQTKSHLFYSNEKIAYSQFILRYQSIALFRPASRDISGE